MAFLDDILGGSSGVTIGEVGVDPLILDVSKREAHNVTGELSDHPVESGIDIVDNYRVLPRVLELEGVVSNSPLTTGFPGASLINSAAGLISGDVDPSVNAWQELQRFFDESVVVTVTTSLKTYDSMVLTSLDVTRDALQANGLFFTLTAREVLFVDTEQGAALALPKVTTGQKSVKKGKNTNTAANAAETGKGESLAHAFKDSFVGFAS